MSSDLKPCPFCGGEAPMESGRYQMDDVMYSFAHVECLSCGACGSGFTEAEKPVESVEALAADAWNRRAERTCHPVDYHIDIDEGFIASTCSECGELLVNFDFEQNPPKPIGYCPNCGAKVVDE